MAQHKFEQEFRKQLQDREIKPSAGSWNKLEAQLEAEESKGNGGKSLWWIGIAACIAGAIFIGGFGLNTNNDTVAPQVVETPVKEETIMEEPANRVPEETQMVATEEPAEPLKKENLPLVKKNKEILKESLKENSALSEVGEKAENIEEVQMDPQPVTGTEKIFSEKLEEVLAQISSEESKDGTVTDAEVDELLKKAAAEINLEHNAEIGTANIDAESLLWEVEMELERSFREKVFDILKEGYLRTRTAVANRNFQSGR